MMKRIVYIGSFGHWPQVAQEFCGRDDVDVVGLAPAYDGEVMDALRNHPALQGNPPVFASASAMLSEAKPDIAVVSTRPDWIARTAILAANAGCDIICEKPLGLTVDETSAVYEAIQRNGVRLLPMLSMRTDAVFIKARELYVQGEIGEAVLMSARKSYPFGNRQEWFGERAKYGGTFPWVGIHATDMIHFITGLGFVSVTARHTNFAHPARPECEDSCAAVFELSNGAFATMTADFLRPSTAPTYGDDRIRIAGTTGVLEAVSNEGAVRLINDAGETVVRAESGSVAFYSEILSDSKAEFPLVAPADGFLLTEAVLSARDSADRNGMFVTIESRWKQ